jgi:DNA primase
MAKIDKNIIDKILETAKIEEVIKDCLGSYGSGNKSGLKKTGVRYEALCPFHDDK